MNILILTGSPRKNGTSNLLLENFLKGIDKEKNTIKRYDTAFLKIDACNACYGCENGKCIKKDRQKMRIRKYQKRQFYTN